MDKWHGGDSKEGMSEKQREIEEEREKSKHG